MSSRCWQYANLRKIKLQISD